MSPTAMPRLREFVPVVLIILICTAVYLALQPPITAGNGYGWDGAAYAALYRRIVLGEAHSIEFPFCLRVATPYIAGLTGLNDSIVAFRAVNLTFAALFSLLIYAVVRSSGLDMVSGLFAVGLTVLPYFSPLRYTAFAAVYTDPGFLALLSAALLLQLHRRTAAAFAVLSAASLFREAAVYLIPWLLLTALWLSVPLRRVLPAAVLSLAVMLGANLLIEQQLQCDASHAKIALKALYERLSDPLHFVRGFAALSMTAAPLVYLRSLGPLSALDRASLFGLLTAAVLALLGGSDTTRIFYSFLPIFLLLLLRVMRVRGPLFLLTCLIGYIVTNRVGRPLLEPQTYLPQRDVSGYFTQFPDHATAETALLILAVWRLLFALHDLAFTYLPVARQIAFLRQSVQRLRRPQRVVRLLLRRLRAGW